MKNKIYIGILIVVLSITAWFVYKLFTKNHNPFDVDISKVNLELNFENSTNKFRRDSILSPDETLKFLKFRKDYTNNNQNLMSFWNGLCLGIDKENDPEYLHLIEQLKKNPKSEETILSLELKSRENDSLFLSAMNQLYYNPLSKEIDSLITNKFEVSKKWKKSITDAFKRLSIHCPNYQIPTKFYFVNSLYGYNALRNGYPIELIKGTILLDKFSMVIQQEKYIGFTQMLYVDKLLKGYIYPYMIEKYDFIFLQRDILENWLENVVFKMSENSDLIHEVIRKGKIYYYINAALPNENKATILRYNQNEWNWASNEEKMIWRHLVENNLVFNSDEKIINSWTSENPYTLDLDYKSPDRLGSFIGFKMIHNFMKENASEDYTLVDLINEPAENIYKLYKP